jgi:hypothetical protein
MYADNEILFPPTVIPKLRQSLGQEWQALVERVANLPESHLESLAFSYMMIRLNGCLACETDSYRAMRGCAPCSRQVLRRTKESEAKLLHRYQASLVEVQAYLHAHPLPEEAEERDVKAA